MYPSKVIRGERLGRRTHDLLHADSIGKPRASELPLRVTWRKSSTIADACLCRYISGGRRILVTATGHRHHELDGAQAHRIAANHVPLHARRRDVGAEGGRLVLIATAVRRDPQVRRSFGQIEPGHAVAVLAAPRLRAFARAAIWLIYSPMQPNSCHRSGPLVPQVLQIAFDKLVCEHARCGSQLPGQLDRAAVHVVTAVNQQTQRARHNPYRPCDGTRSGSPGSPGSIDARTRLRVGRCPTLMI